MKLLYLDTFEAVSSGSNWDQGTALSRFLNSRTVRDGTAGQLPTISVVAGDVSDRAVRLSSRGSSYNLFASFTVGDETLYQTSGKAVFHASFMLDDADTTTSNTLFRLATGATNEDDYVELMMNRDTKAMSLLGEYADASEWVQGTFAAVELIIDLDMGTFGVYLNNNFLFGGTHAITKLWNAPWFISTRTQYAIVIDDIYVLGGTDGSYADRLGPVRVRRLALDAEKSTEFSPENVGSNIAAVNKTDRSGSTFNRSPGENGKQDRFTVDVSELPDDKDIFAVQQLIYYRKTDIGDRGLKSIITDAGGINVDARTLPQNVINFAGPGLAHLITQVPGGGTLDKESIADLEFGYEVTAS